MAQISQLVIKILTEKSTATSDTDYMVDALMDTFSLSQATPIERLVITGKTDTVYEGDETIVVQYTSSNGVFLNDQGEKVASIEVTYIIDDSIAAPMFTVSDRVIPVSTLSIQDPTPSAATISFDFPISVDNVVDITVSADVAAGTTATEMTDFTLSTDMVTHTSGSGNRSSSIVITIPTTAVFSGEELIVLDLTATNALFF